jgi:homoserine kinase
MPNTVTVTVPATTANLGPGFDCIGAALTLYNTLRFSNLKNTSSETLIITVQGTEAAVVQTDESNLAYQAFIRVYQHLGQTPPPVQIEIDLGVPLARGLGSSATAIVGGLIGANTLAGNPLNQGDILQLAIEIEGHPDNVVPALLGNCQLSVSRGENGTGWEICEIPWHSDLVPVLAIPDFELSTAEARKVLPQTYSRADAIFNTAHLGLLIRGLETRNPDWLMVALQDKIHQPYRKSLIKGFETVRSAALQAGAFELVISGAGPTLLALTDEISAPAVAVAMTMAWKQEGVNPEVKVLQLDTQGATTTNIE